MKTLAYYLGMAFGGAAVVFVESMVLTFIIKKIVVAFAKSDRKKSIEENFSVLKTSLVYACIAAGLSLFGVSSNTIGFYSIPFMVVGGLIIANTK